MFSKKTISCILAISFTFSYLVFAEEIMTQEPEQAEFSYEPEIHVEEVDHWILLGDEDEAVDKGTPPKKSPWGKGCFFIMQQLLAISFESAIRR